MNIDIGGEDYEYEKWAGLLPDPLENDHSYNLWLDGKIEEDQEGRYNARCGNVVRDRE